MFPALFAPLRPRRSLERRLTATLCAYAFFDDLILLYPVYALLFSDTGLSVWQISSLFVIWSTCGIVLEVPSGAWADAVSRKLMLSLGPLLTAIAFALWVLAPSYWAFALGFALWGLKGALGSGALEALVYEELDRVGAAARYATVMGRATAASLIGALVALAVAGPVLSAGGYPAVGAASVVACLITGVVAAMLPEHRERAGGEDDDGDAPGWVATLRVGLAEARHTRSVRVAVLVCAFVTAIWGALDEYTPLLARDTGVADSTVPLLLLVIWSGATVGSLLAGRGARLSARGFAALLVVAAALLAVGALTGHPAGMVLVGIAFGGFQLASVVADARLQESITGPARATVTSMAGMATDATTLAVYGTYAVFAGASGHAGAFAILALPYAIVACWMVRGRRPVGAATRM